MDELKADKRIFVLAEEKPVKAVVKMGVPVTMGMLFMVVYNLVDTYFILKIRQNTPTSKRSEGGEMNAARFCVNK